MVSVSDKVGTVGNRWDKESAGELVDLLAKLGLEQRQACVIGYLATHDEARSHDLEKACDMRQPQVSQATTALRDRGWVKATHEQTSGKGRPPNVYSLDLGLEEVVEEVTARRREQINQEMARIERARSLVQAREGPGSKPDETEPREPEPGPRQGQG